MGVGKLKTVHSEFVMKNNPYIDNENANKAHTILVMAEAGTFSSLLFFTLTLSKIKPNITLNSAFKKSTFAQFIISLCLYGYYAFQLNNLSKMIPEEELRMKV